MRFARVNSYQSGEFERRIDGRLTGKSPAACCISCCAGHKVPRTPSRRPSKFARCNLLDFLYPFCRGVEPNADAAVTLAELRRNVLDCRPGLSDRLQSLDNP